MYEVISMSIMLIIIGPQKMVIEHLVHMYVIIIKKQNNIIHFTLCSMHHCKILL